jgi:hypothetical protein
MSQSGRCRHGMRSSPHGSRCRASPARSRQPACTQPPRRPTAAARGKGRATVTGVSKRKVAREGHAPPWSTASRGARRRAASRGPSASCPCGTSSRRAASCRPARTTIAASGTPGGSPLVAGTGWAQRSTWGISAWAVTAKRGRGWSGADNPPPRRRRGQRIVRRRTFASGAACFPLRGRICFAWCTVNGCGGTRARGRYADSSVPCAASAACALIALVRSSAAPQRCVAKSTAWRYAACACEGGTRRVQLVRGEGRDLSS